MSDSIDVFDDGISFVRLVETGGDELTIVNAARVSLHNESEYEQVNTEQTEVMYDFSDSSTPDISFTNTKLELSKADKGLLNFLLKNKHGSPFEHNWFSFHIRLPIFVMREWVRHRVGFSINEESGRYVEMRPDFFIPDHIRTQEGKPGAYTFKESDDVHLYDTFISLLSEASDIAYKKYKWALDRGIAKEQARLFLPLNLYTECRWTCNARSLMNFLALRAAPDAMKEIRDYAYVLEDIFAEEMPNVHEAFVNAGRVAP